MDKIQSLLSILLSVAVLATGCVSKNEDNVLECFPSLELLHPEDSADLSAFNILLPEDIVKHGNGYFIKYHSSKYAVDYVEPSSGRQIHCFLVGRGPQELIRPSSLGYSKDTVFIYDIAMRRYYSLNAPATVAKSAPEIEICRSFQESGDPSVNRPFIVTKSGNTIISTGLFDEPFWFGLIDSSAKMFSGIDFVDYDAIRNFPDVSKHALFLSTYFSVRPDGKKLVAALHTSAAVSICTLSDSILREEKRIVYSEPVVTVPSGEYDPVITYSPHNKNAFCCVASDNMNIYLLYSGKTFTDDEPSYECNYLLKMDWEGKAVKSYRLSESINSFYLEGNMIYGVSSHPDSRLYVYSLD